MKTKRAWRLAALFLGMCVLAFSLLSLAVSVAHTGHTCHSADTCEICMCLQNSARLIKLLRCACGALFALLPVLVAASTVAWALGGRLAARSPLSLRVRMNQ